MVKVFWIRRVFWLHLESVLAASGVREGVVVKVFCIRSERSSASGVRGRLKVLCIRREGECFGKGLLYQT